MTYRAYIIHSFMCVYVPSVYPPISSGTVEQRIALAPHQLLARLDMSHECRDAFQRLWC